VSDAEVTREGLRGVHPGRNATPGTDTVPGTESGRRRRGRAGRRDRPGRRAEQPMVPPAEFASYYGKPILNAPVWRSPDIPGYLFLGGLAGGSSLMAAGAQLTGRPGLARVSKAAAAGAICLGLAGLVADLGRPVRLLEPGDHAAHRLAAFREAHLRFSGAADARQTRYRNRSCNGRNHRDKQCGGAED